MTTRFIFTPISQEIWFLQPTNDTRNSKVSKCPTALYPTDMYLTSCSCFSFFSKFYFVDITFVLCRNVQSPKQCRRKYCKTWIMEWARVLLSTKKPRNMVNNQFKCVMVTSWILNWKVDVIKQYVLFCLNTLQ